MSVVATGLVSSPVPGIWRRLSLISDDGSLHGLEDARLTGQLDELGIPRHQLGLARLLQSWQRARVPPDVAFALWLLRRQHEEQGCLYRRENIRVAESSPAIRYVQLAVGVGETLDTDPTLRQVVAWLLDQQKPDGSVPLLVATGHGETGQTCRTLRALRSLGDPSLKEQVDRMTRCLLDTARPQEIGVAWSYSAVEDTVVTGSTSLALTALVEHGEQGDVMRAAADFLVHAQDSTGGWAEVPGYPPTIQNTFQTVRALHIAEKAGILDDVGPCLERASEWFIAEIGKSFPRSTSDLAFALRLAVVFELLDWDRVEQLARKLAGRRREILTSSADLYAETELTAIAFMECSRYVDSRSDGKQDAWTWRWELPSLPPPFLQSEGYFYELLYSMVNRRWWVRAIDRLRDGNVLEHSVALLFATIVAIGLVNELVTQTFALTQLDGPRMVAAAVVLLAVVAWLVVKAAARSLGSGSAWRSTGAVVAALTITWIFSGSASLAPDLLLVAALRWLVIDVVAYTSDRAGLLERLLPKN